MSDLIDREEAIKRLKMYGAEHNAIAVINGCPSAETQKWIPCSEPPENDRSVFVAYGSKGLKSCCIGYYEPQDKQWREQKNFFASLIYDAKYWCDMPELPEGWYE